MGDGHLMDDIRELALRFEAVKVAIRQDKNGHMLTLAIHPNDGPEELLRSPVGQRYVVAMVALGESDTPLITEANKEAADAVKIAGTMCRNDRFREWVNESQGLDLMTEGEVVEWMHGWLRIDTRADLRHNKEAREGFKALRDAFTTYLRRG